MSISRKLFISAAAISAALGIGLSIQQPTLHANARRRYRTYRPRIRKYHYGYFRGNVWHKYRSGHYTRNWRWVANRSGNSATISRYQHRSVRRHPARRVHRYHIVAMNGKSFGWTTNYRTYKNDIHELNTAIRNYRARKAAASRHGRYHILVDGIDGGWTNNYRTYKSSVNALKNAIQAHNGSNQPARRHAAQPRRQPVRKPARQHGLAFYGPNDDDRGNMDKPSDFDFTNDQDPNGFAARTRTALIADINKDREARGLQPYTENADMDKVAYAMADTDNEINGHYNSQGQVRNGIYAKELGVPVPWCGYFSENLDGSFAGKDQAGDEATTEDDSTPEKAAASSENDMMNNDQQSDNGHRDNIISPDNTEMGVGVHSFVDGNGRPQYKIAEEFN